MKRKPSEVTMHQREASAREQLGLAAAMCAALGVPPTEEARGIGDIYFIYSEAMKAIKIGFSFDTARRMKMLQTASACPLELLGTVRGTEADERALHKKFATIRRTGEWFKDRKRLRDYIAGAAIR